MNMELSAALPEGYLDFLRELDNSKYALDNNGSLVTDFIYDECGSLSDGLFAVCQDGKWGYVNEQGDIVIPIEYDKTEFAVVTGPVRPRARPISGLIDPVPRLRT